MRFQELLPHLDGVRCPAMIDHVIYRVVITVDDDYVLPAGSVGPRPGYTGHVNVDVLGFKERNHVNLRLDHSEAKELARKLVEAAGRAGADWLHPIANEGSA